MHRRLLLATFFAIGCGPTGTPQLTLEGPTSVFRDGATISLRVVASDATGKVGSGTVTVVADVGTADPETLTLDEFGTARFTYSCDVKTTPDCAIPRANLKVHWNLKPIVTIEQPITLRDRPVVPDGGMGGGSAGGACSQNYSRLLCSGGQTPGPTLACCKMGDLIPACTDVYLCDGQRTQVRYLRARLPQFDAGVPPDAGVEVTVDLIWSIPTRRTTSQAECLAKVVGFEYEYSGTRGTATRAFHTYGLVQEASGDFTGIRQAELRSLHPLFDEECTQAGTLPDAGPTAVWNSYELGNFVATENGAFYRYTLTTGDRPRFFFYTLLR